MLFIMTVQLYTSRTALDVL